MHAVPWVITVESGRTDRQREVMEIPLLEKNSDGICLRCELFFCLGACTIVSRRSLLLVASSSNPGWRAGYHTWTFLGITINLSLLPIHLPAWLAIVFFSYRYCRFVFIPSASHGCLHSTPRAKRESN
jgi:hypothetical protein